ncbi:uracil-DNA glycosylase family protein [Agromyces aurantiacus]|uniref:Uracil-DNA glycosylase family protein n=1 Tax=Agromyces aurantiacus TaxID=165814 RepID=A0ABV9R420_9MICO|nr:uracil-DNA glycosylase family protein [Agromyces aurantiacus]
MGSQILTLADVWPDDPRAMIVGLNPAPESVAAGHYYQGRAGRGQLLKLADTGLFPRPSGPHFEGVALASGVGFTDIVKRPSVGEGDVTKEEIRYGSAQLADKLGSAGMGLVICVFRHPVRALLGTDTGPGLQPTITSWGGRVFRMPGPYDKRENVQRVLQQLSSIVSAL